VNRKPGSTSGGGSPVRTENPAHSAAVSPMRSFAAAGPKNGAIVNGVVGVVGAVDRVIQPDEQTVGTDKLTLSQRADKHTISGENPYRMFAAVENEDAILVVNSHGDRFRPRPTGRRFRPLIVGSVAKVPTRSRRRDGWVCRSARRHESPPHQVGEINFSSGNSGIIQATAAAGKNKNPA
jgi:hypothetical protein